MKITSVFTSIVFMSIILSIPHAVQSSYAAPGTGTLYGLDSFFGNLLTVNPITGQAITSTPILDDAGTPGDSMDDVPIPFGMPALAIDPTSGILYLGTGSGTSDLYILNPTTGEAAYQCSLTFSAIEDLAFDSTGNLYASVNTAGGGSGGGTDLIEMDTSCNIINGPFPFGFGGMGGLDFDAFDVLYGATSGANGQLYTINTGNGVPTAVGQLNQPGGVASLQFDCNGALFGGTGRGGQIGQSDLVSINVGSGAALVVGAGGTVLDSTLGGLAFAQSCEDDSAIGGEILPISTVSLLLAGMYSGFAWILPAALSAIGIGALVIRKTRQA